LNMPTAGPGVAGSPINPECAGTELSAMTDKCESAAICTAAFKALGP
jgi:hypothetical protein